MIGRICGLLLEKSPLMALVDCAGVGYEVHIPASTFDRLPALNQQVTLQAHTIVREDAHLLYGFATIDEREAFRQLIKISGIGPRMAIAVLSGLSVDDLVHCINQQDTGRLVKIPGIGKKTAERLLLELKDKFHTVGGASIAGGRESLPIHGDIMQALLALGYREREVSSVIKALPADTSVAEGVRLALRQLGRE